MSFLGANQAYKWRKTIDLADFIDKELVAQVSVQSGCYYVPSDDCGVAGADMNIVVTQLARKILEYLDNEQV